MSAQTHSNDSVTCGQCDEHMDVAQAVKGAYCSSRCYYIDKGASALNRIQTDHRWCVNCFRPIKTVYRPAERTLRRKGMAERVREAFDGIQTSTRHSTIGVDEFHSKEIGNSDDKSMPTLEGTRLSCECGTVNVRERHEFISHLDPVQRAEDLWDALVALEEDGTLPERPDKTAFVDALAGDGGQTEGINPDFITTEFMNRLKDRGWELADYGRTSHTLEPPGTPGHSLSGDYSINNREASNFAPQQLANLAGYSVGEIETLYSATQ